MNFWEATYSGVTWWQLFGGWLLFGFLLPFVVFRRPKTVIETVEVPKPISGRETADLVRQYIVERDSIRRILEARVGLHTQDLHTLSRTIEKVRILEAKITRLTVRPRDKSGRFQKGKA